MKLFFLFVFLLPIASVSQNKIDSEKFDVSFKSYYPPELISSIRNYLDHDLDSLVFVSISALPDTVYTDLTKKKIQYISRTQETIIDLSYNRTRPEIKDTIDIRDFLDFSRLSVLNTLTKKSCKKLLPIVFSGVDRGFGAECYMPRHGVLFYKDNVVNGFVEICFECSQVHCLFNSFESKNFEGVSVQEIEKLCFKAGLLEKP